MHFASLIEKILPWKAGNSYYGKIYTMQNTIKIMCCLAFLAIHVYKCVLSLYYMSVHLVKWIFAWWCLISGCRWHLACTLFSKSTKLLYWQTHLDKKMFAVQSFSHLHPNRMLCFKSILTLLMLKKCCIK